VLVKVLLKNVRTLPLLDYQCIFTEVIKTVKQFNFKPKIPMRQEIMRMTGLQLHSIREISKFRKLLLHRKKISTENTYLLRHPKT